MKAEPTKRGMSIKSDINNENYATLCTDSVEASGYKITAARISQY